jgi:hypothetical protein
MDRLPSVGLTDCVLNLSALTQCFKGWYLPSNIVDPFQIVEGVIVVYKKFVVKMTIHLMFFPDHNVCSSHTPA